MYKFYYPYLAAIINVIPGCNSSVIPGCAMLYIAVSTRLLYYCYCTFFMEVRDKK